MEPPPPCEHCAQSERELKLAEELDAAQEAYLQLLLEHRRLQEAYAAQLERRCRDLTRQRR